MGEQARVTDDIGLLLGILPPARRAEVEGAGNLDDLLEIVLDLGRIPEARYPDGCVCLGQTPVTAAEIGEVVSRLGEFSGDNRAGLERTLHRISAIRNRRGEIIGLTCRVGRAVYGTIALIRDLVETGKNILLLGRPGVGKTTMLREIARVLSGEFGKRVIVVDTSNEIAGDGDVPHPGIGRARRMQVAAPERQHAVMIEAVENHMPEVIIVDEIGTEREALAARTIAERGVQLVGTAHGNTLDNLWQNPTLADLVGGIQVVTLSDEEARKRKTQKTILERKSPPTFDILVEIHAKDSLAVHSDLAAVVDLRLRGFAPQPELRTRDSEGNTQIVQAAAMTPPAAPDEPALAAGAETEELPVPAISAEPGRVLRIFPYAISRDKIEKAARHLQVPVEEVKTVGEADVLLTIKAQQRRAPGKISEAERLKIPVCVLRGNSVTSIERFLQTVFAAKAKDRTADPIAEAEQAARTVRQEFAPVELQPQNAAVRRLQHLVAEKYQLKTRSIGQEPNRRVVFFAD